MHLFTALMQWLKDYSGLLCNEQGYNYCTVVMKTKMTHGSRY